MAERFSQWQPEEGLRARRFTGYPFPAYRHVPGQSPHPAVDPAGHSYGFDPPFPVEPVEPEDWRLSGAYLYGCDLYNHGYWWEAHEAWEAVWQIAPAGTPQRAFLQGLIQVANCHLKLHMGKVRVLERLRRSCQAHFDESLSKAPAHFMGIDLPSWRASVDAYLSHTREGEPAMHIPARYPYLLPGDRGLD